MIRRIDALAYESRLRRLPAAHKLLFSLAALILALISHPPVQALLFAWMSVWILVYARTPWRVYVAVVGASLVFLLAGMPALLLEAARLETAAPAAGVLASRELGGWVVYVTEEGFRRGWALAVRSQAAFVCFAFLFFTVPFAELLQVFRRLGVPAVLTDLLMIMYRFIFVLLETAQQMWIAQRARGGHAGMTAALKDAARLVFQLFARAMLRYRQMYISMTARGFADDFQVIGTVASAAPSKRYQREAAAGLIALAILEWWMRG